jgi:hypothetical protein
VLSNEIPPARGTELARAAGRIDDIGEDHRREDPFVPGVALPAVGSHRLEVDRHPRLVADHPGIVAGWDLEDVTRMAIGYFASNGSISISIAVRLRIGG